RAGFRALPSADADRRLPAWHRAHALGSAASATLASDMSFLILVLPLIAPLATLATPRVAAAGPDLALQAQIELRSGRTLEGPLVAADSTRLTVQAGDDQESAPLDELLLLALSPSAAD